VRRKIFAAALAALSIAGTLVLGTPANATVSQGYIMGSGSVLDDLTDEGPVRQGNYSGAVAVWQAILWADGYLSTGYDASVDCSFGPNTLAATKEWQRDHGLTADGVPGPLTFTKAGQYLKDAGTNIYGERIINARHGNQRRTRTLRSADTFASAGPLTCPTSSGRWSSR
jgi:peptidoglycan hydrolase-like protein with peptidoglycan-binding domain